MTLPADIDGIAVPTTAQLVDLRHRARHLQFFPRRQAVAVTAGNYRSRFRGRGMDFDEVRPYQPGDDVRTIDWRVTARTNVPHTKVFREERERPVLIAVDLRSPMFFGSTRLKSVVAAEIAALLAWAGLNANDRVGGLILSPSRQRDLRSRRSHHNVLQFVHGLRDACADLLAPRQDSHNLCAFCENIRRVISPGTALVIISDFNDLDYETEKQLFQLSRHCDLTLAAITDPLESELPPPGSYAVSDGRQQQNLDTRNVKLRDFFHRRRRQHQQLLEAMAARLGAGLLRFSTAEDYMPTLLAYYGNRKGGKRR